VVGLFARLKLRLIAGNLRDNPGRQVGFAISAALALAFGGGGFLTALGLRAASDDVGPGVAVIVFSMLTLGWLTLPVLAFGVDETLDPSRLALLPLRRRDIAVGMLTSSAVGVWPAASLLVLVGLVLGTAPSPLGALVGVAAVALQLGLCITLSRAATTSLAGVLRTRRGRDFLLVIGLVIALLAQLPNLILNGAVRVSPTRHTFDRIVDVLAWGPPGMAARAVAEADPLRLVPLAGAVALVGWWWMVVLGRTQVSVDRSTPAAAVRRRRWNPTGQLGGVAVKELTYMRREPRRTIGLVTALAMSVVVTLSWGRYGAVGVPAVALGAVLLGMQSANAYGSDGPALWMNAIAWTSRRDVQIDLAGRHLASTLVAAPVLLAMAIASCLLISTPGDIPSAYLVGLTVLGAALGIGSVTSVLTPYALPDRMNAFSGAAPGQGGKAFLGSLGVMAGTAALASPVLVLVAVGAPVWALALGLPYAALLAWAGRAAAARVAYPRLPEILAAVSARS
jgi:ABC-2 type transport system permease protein